MLSACASQARTAGRDSSELGSSSPFIAPHSECPQMTMSVTPRAETAYSMVAASPPEALLPCAGTMLPAFRRMNTSPGSVCVSVFGLIRESEHVMNKVLGDELSFLFNIEGERYFAATVLSGLSAAQLGGRFETVIRADEEMIGSHLPAILNITVALDIDLWGHPASAGKPLARLIARQVDDVDPAKF